jgi:hypothetical protein
VVALAPVRLAYAQQPPDADADVEIPAGKQPEPPKPPPAPPPPVPAAQRVSEIEALRAEMREERAKLDARIKALEGELAAQKSAPAEAAPKPASSAAGGSTPLSSVLGQGAWGIGAYVQTQYEQHQESQDQIQQGGVYLNQDRFLVRRGRIQVDAAWRWIELRVLLDGNTLRGFTVGPRRLEASIVWRSKPWEGQLPATGRDADVPYLKLTGGLTEIPFGFELPDGHRERVFMERTLASQALFPGEQDVGARLSGGVGFFRYAIAAMNGTPLDDRNALPVGDPNKAKDIVARLGVDARPTDSFRLSGGVSALYGSGFHAGTDATKDSITWRDLNQNGAIDAGELTPVPGTAATPSVNFTHWAVGADLQLRLRTPIGQTMLYGEAVIASNLDRGLFVADPIATGVDVRHFGAYGAITQEITPYAIVGFRFDYYDPNADFFDKRGGKLLPTSQAIKTFSPVIGAQFPGRARLLFQYDAVRDLLAKDRSGVPADLKNDRFTVRLQVQL